MTLIQSRILVDRIFNLLIYSLVIKIAILVDKAVLLEILMPTPRQIKPIVEELIVVADPISFSVIIINTFFLFKLLYFFL